jgi:hypothetical protein
VYDESTPPEKAHATPPFTLTSSFRLSLKQWISMTLNCSGNQQLKTRVYSRIPYTKPGDNDPRTCISSPSIIANGSNATANPSALPVTNSSQLSGNSNHSTSGVLISRVLISTRADTTTCPFLVIISGG